MKKICMLFILLIVPGMVSAATCPAQDKADLLTLSSVVSVNYEEKQVSFTGEEVGYPDTLPEEEYEDYIVTYDYFEISVYNIPEEFYVVVKNNINDEQIIIESSDLENGIYTFTHQTISEVTTYTFTVYASSDTNCKGEAISYKYLTIPKYNVFSGFEMCYSYPDEAVCQKYTTTTNYTEGYVLSKLSSIDLMQKSDDLSEDDLENGIVNYFKDNYLYFIIGGVGIIGVVVVVVLVKRKRSDLK